MRRRIETLAALTQGTETLADIGADHAYVAISAVLGGFAQRALACDINPKPLCRARENIAQAGLSERIQARQGAGFAPIAPGEADAAVIAGMGGLLICQILEEGAAQVQQLKRMALAPQSDVAAVRRKIHAAGFRLRREEFLQEDGAYYNVLLCEKGAEPPYTEAEYIAGRLLLAEASPIFRQYAREQAQTLGKIARRLEREAQSDKVRARRGEVAHLLAIYQGIE